MDWKEGNCVFCRVAAVMGGCGTGTGNEVGLVLLIAGNYV